jgi:uncharacterized protein (DUF2147 family)
MKQLNLNLRLSALLLSVAITGIAQTTPATDNITGLYWSPKKDAKIEIYQKAGKFYGKSVWVASPKKDFKNPDKTLQTRDVLGIELLNGFTYKDGSYADGTIYDPQSGKTYDCKMSLNGNNLKVRGYIGISLFGRTENFERIK